MRLKALEMLAERIEQEAMKEFVTRNQFRYGEETDSEASARQDWYADQYWGYDADLREECIQAVIDRLFDKE